MNAPDVQAFFDEATHTVSYVVSDASARRAAVIDPVLDFDAPSGRTSTGSADAIADYVRERDLGVDWILETHVHADHLTAAPHLCAELGGRIAIGRDVTIVQEMFRSVFNLPGLATDGGQFDHLFADDERFAIGDIEARVMFTPGHTPACVTYLVGDAALVGDTLFMPDSGTARTDFPGGSAATLYDSIRKILSLPSETRLFMCHDYKAPKRDEYAWQTTVAEQRENNLHVGRGTTREAFVELREARDATLGMPALILPAIQVNIRAGRLPDAEDNGIRYLRLPLNRF